MEGSKPETKVYDTERDKRLSVKTSTFLMIDEVEIADKSSAESFREKTSIKQKNEDGSYSNYPVCSTSQETLGKYGMGLQLYFLFLNMFILNFLIVSFTNKSFIFILKFKHLGFLFFLISLMSVWPMIENYNGRGLGSAIQTQRFLYFSLANQNGIDNNETDLQKAKIMLNVIKENLEKI